MGPSFAVTRYEFKVTGFDGSCTEPPTDLRGLWHVGHVTHWGHEAQEGQQPPGGATETLPLG